MKKSQSQVLHTPAQMVSTSQKIETKRIATAQAILESTTEVIERVRKNDLPKKDVLTIARTAAVMAAKKTGELIPYCHPLVLDQIQIDFELLESSIQIFSTVTTISKTGVEMEALTAASVAALTLYDMLKPLNQSLEITGIKLLSKYGGKSTYHENIPAAFKPAVIVSSDSTAAGTRKDKSGLIIKDRLESYGLAEIQYVILPDDQKLIQTEIKRMVAEQVGLIFTTGGTGLGPRDVTVEAVSAIIEKEVPGISEAMRDFGQKQTPYAMLSRGVAGLIGKTLVVTLPGSSGGASESLDAVFPYILHAFPMMQGGGH